MIPVAGGRRSLGGALVERFFLVVTYAEWPLAAVLLSGRREFLVDGALILLEAVASALVLR